MTTISTAEIPLQNPHKFFIGGEWVTPSTDSTIEVFDSTNGEPYFTIAEAQPADIDRAVAAAREAFDVGPWPSLTHHERAEYLRAMHSAIMDRSADIADMWSRQSGVLNKVAQRSMGGFVAPFTYYADLADSFAFEELATPTAGGAFGLVVREPVGVVGAIIPWNAPIGMIANKIAPALLAGCTVVLKSSPEAPGEVGIVAEIAEQIGLPPGVLNCVTADREVSELLVRDPRVDKISFTGSTAAGRRIASICGERIARCTLELGGKSAAVILDDAEIETAAKTLARAETFLSGQVCSSLTRVVVPQHRHDEFADALAAAFSAIQVGDPFDPSSHMGPLAAQQQVDRVLGYIEKGKDQGAKLLTGGGRPAHPERGYYVEPTVFSRVDNRHTIAQEEIFGPVLSVIPAADEEDAVRIANDTIFGLNASVFTADAGRARAVAARLRSGTVGHNNMRSDFGIGFGGFKQSGIGREGGRDGILPYLESKTIILDDTPPAYQS